ncbi:MAG TPA: M23 family metallopeptidase [Actinophytocola sp.]|jgi:murein DD-endopeptidase MepM/ murein hydrolase activator NlpD|uniref:M23 family metallopeptidase n=1 Tax=Actinophytocola sp. TaxID=1872138 RepID=UPI002F91EFE2
MPARRGSTRIIFAIAILLGALVVAPPAATAQPSLDDQIAKADAELRAAQVKLGKTFGRFTAAEKRHKSAVAAVKAARVKERRARTESAAAARLEENTRGRFDQFTDANYRGGNTVTSVTALLTSDSPDDMLKRASMLNVLGGEYAEVVDKMSTAAARKAKASGDARQAVADAASNRDKAAKAETDAKRAYTAALAAQKAAKSETDQLAQRKAGLLGQSVTVGDGAVVKPTVGTLTSGFGPRDGTIHYGQDIANAIGTPILAAMAGEVIDAGPASGFGQWVRVQHSGGLITVYGHVATFTVTVGQIVAAGQQIATMGNEGQSTGPHLHFEVHQDGTAIDPLPWLRSNGVDI